jgi:hypothetical protein
MYEGAYIPAALKLRHYSGRSIVVHLFHSLALWLRYASAGLRLLQLRPR